ncbi:hypothetical protein PIIN_03340 [Serendipita indica DSM 11827]|uniref:MARVEL domain-containing protein n=1 Tax=Serendipita indica (strain DSM 11827) TaxID=1109443 RepID=G4TDQ5_SERID|nr:hypothetical protein PIIN_03340 [Serendipita indica DSM 11827]
MIATVRRVRTTSRGLLAIASIIILSLSTHINWFMGFFYIADRLPFVLSILTLATLVLTSILDLAKGGNAVTARPMVESALLVVFTILWTGANGFSTPRWNTIQPGVCSSISIASNPSFQSGVRMWCQEMIVLRAFVWIEWIILLGSLLLLVSYCFKQARKGRGHIWVTPLAHFDPHEAEDTKWDAKSRVFSHMSWGIRGDRTPYAFDMQTPRPYQTEHQQTQENYHYNDFNDQVPTPRPAAVIHNYNNAGDTLRSVGSQHSGQALVGGGYQSTDPFNIPKDRPISLASSGEGAVQPSNWRSFTQHGFDKPAKPIANGAMRTHGYSTSIEHHSRQPYAF